MDAIGYFAQTYAQARDTFFTAADAAGLDVESHPHPMLGRDGEALALDVVLEGPKHAESLLIVSSGCHGVEGFCGSGLQAALLHDPAWHAAVREADVAVLYLHALNPYGFSWWRRATHENVDLNRNFQDFHRPLPESPAYDEIAALLVPPTWPPSDEVDAALGRLLAERGLRVMQAAVTGGQYSHPEGLFFGGHDPTWSHVTLRHVLRERASDCARLGWIDVHSGLGESGVGERIYAGRADDAPARQRARAWWGPRVTAIDDGSSTSAPLTGMMWEAAAEDCPRAEITAIALEFGTLPILDTITALRAEQWLENHPEADEAQRVEIKRRMRNAFFTDTDAWKRRVIEQGFEAAHQAIAGLRNP